MSQMLEPNWGLTHACIPFTPVKTEIHCENVVCQDLVINNRSISELIGSLDILSPPADLDTSNPNVMECLQIWLAAVENLRKCHEQLRVVIALTKENE